MRTVLCPGYIQKGATKVTANNLNALTGYQPIKYIAESKYDGANKAFTDWSLFRTAEVYLNYAEGLPPVGYIPLERRSAVDKTFLWLLFPIRRTIRHG